MGKIYDMTDTNFVMNDLDVEYSMLLASIEIIKLTVP